MSVYDYYRLSLLPFFVAEPTFSHYRMLKKRIAAIRRARVGIASLETSPSDSQRHLPPVLSRPPSDVQSTTEPGPQIEDLARIQADLTHPESPPNHHSSPPSQHSLAALPPQHKVGHTESALPPRRKEHEGDASPPSLNHDRISTPDGHNRQPSNRSRRSPFSLLASRCKYPLSFFHAAS
jgi:hypothetical protein